MANSVWTIDRVMLLDTLAGFKTAQEIGDRLGVTKKAVEAQAHKMDLSLAIDRLRWEPEEDTHLMQQKAKGVKEKEIAKQLGRTVKAVNHRIRVLRARDEE